MKILATPLQWVVLILSCTHDTQSTISTTLLGHIHLNLSIKFVGGGGGGGINIPIFQRLSQLWAFYLARHNSTTPSHMG